MGCMREDAGGPSGHRERGVKASRAPHVPLHLPVRRTTSPSMCGRITQKSPPDQLGLRIIMGTPDDPRVKQHAHPLQRRARPGALGHPPEPQDRRAIAGPPVVGTHPVLGQGATGGASRSTPRPRRSPRCRCSATPTSCGAASCPLTISSSGRPIKGAKAKQPYAIAMKSGQPFAVAAIWENWKRPGTRGLDTHVRRHHLPRQRHDG